MSDIVETVGLNELFADMLSKRPASVSQDIKAGQEFVSDGIALFVVTAADYARLLEAAECDDMIVRCEGCGAWLDRDEPETCTVSDVTGCWAYATGNEKDDGVCKRHRVCEKSM